ncbi:hypothetical protein EQH57_0581, partial [Dictyocoela roeselum]
DFSDINNVLRDKWSYACREPSPIIARTMIAARHFQGKEEGVMNVVYVFFCPDMYLGDFQTISYNNLGECGSFVGIMHSSIDKVFRKRVEEAVIGILLQGLYHLGKKDFNTEKYLCRYARTCFTREEDVKIKE